MASPLLPVPPYVGERTPETAAGIDRLIGPNVGVPPSLGTDKTCQVVPAAVDSKLPLSLPMMTPLEEKDEAPVPPNGTLNTPDPIMLVGSFGTSVTSKLAP